MIRFVFYSEDEAVEELLKHGSDTTLRQIFRKWKKPLTALEISRDQLPYMKQLLADSPNPVEAKIGIERYRRTLALLSGATQS